MTGRKDPRTDILGKSSGKLTCQESIPTCRRNRKVAPSTAARPRRVSIRLRTQLYLHAPRRRHKLWTFPAAPLSRRDSEGRPTPRTDAGGPRARARRPGRAGMPDGGRRGPVPGRPVTEEAGAKSSCLRLLGGGRPGLGRHLHADGPRPGHSDHASAGRRGPSLTGGRQ